MLKEKQIVFINLTENSVTYSSFGNALPVCSPTSPVDAAIALLQSRINRAINPLSGENTIVITDCTVKQPLAYCCTISPIGFCFVDNVISGRVAEALHNTGLLGIVITGKAQNVSIALAKDFEIIEGEGDFPLLATDISNSDCYYLELFDGEKIVTRGGVGAVFASKGLHGIYLIGEKQPLKHNCIDAIAQKNVDKLKALLLEQGLPKDMICSDEQIESDFEKGTRYAAYKFDLEQYATAVRGIEVDKDALGIDYSGFAFTYDYLARLLFCYVELQKSKQAAGLVYQLEWLSYCLLALGVDVSDYEGNASAVLAMAKEQFVSLIVTSKQRRQTQKQSTRIVNAIHTINNYFGVRKAYDVFTTTLLEISKSDMKKLLKTYYKLSKLNSKAMTKEYFAVNDL